MTDTTLATDTLASACGISPEQLEAAALDLALEINRFVAHQCLPNHYRQLFRSTIIPLSAWLAREAGKHGDRPLMVGLSGAQGTGKSTFSKALVFCLERLFRLPVCPLSLDDYYLPQQERNVKAESIHPLFATRGVPGTHDLDVLNDTLDKLSAADADSSVTMTRFDKSKNDRARTDRRDNYLGRPAIILLEGWCVGVDPEDEDALGLAINDLETTEDPSAIWRHEVNRRLRTDYATLFARLDRQIYLQAPDWNAVTDWRTLQENQLLGRVGGSDGYVAGLADIDRMQRFLKHYERITKLMMRTAPKHADVVLELDRRHHISGHFWHPQH